MKTILSLAFLCISLNLKAQTFPTNFVFGVANAPGQVEDQLEDIWLAWGKQGKVRSWQVTPQPEKRLEFWTKPETEIALAKNLGVQSFRMGIDWGRVMISPAKFDEKAISRYKEIVKLVRASGMKIMMTLWHHSVPVWVQESGGWHNEKNKKAFITFSQRMIREFNDDVEWWLTFNEANVFVTMAYTVGIWPPGEKASPLALAALGPFRGNSIEAMDRMADAHNEIYTWAHKEFPSIKVGVAHNMANYRGKNVINQIKAHFANELMNWRFPERIRGHMDFFGFNYYGAEWLKGTQVDIDPEEEYSEAGRAIDVNGLYEIIKTAHEKFNLPIIITENGVADANDHIRSAYLIEHLLAVEKAIAEKIPVIGYYVWSLTDNLEWSDGYCPKFGLVSVKRETMERVLRPSYHVYQQIIATKTITNHQREDAWKKVLSMQGKEHPFCRDEDGITAFDEARPKKYSTKDWRGRFP
jgi:galactolipid galactosyltransferase